MLNGYYKPGESNYKKKRRKIIIVDVKARRARDGKIYPLYHGRFPVNDE